MIRNVLLIVMVWAAPSVASADQSQDEVKRLVAQLDAPKRAARDAAEAELLARGPAILDLLPADDGHLPAEARQRIGRIRRKLEPAAANAVAKASTITFHAEDAPLSTILDAFREQSGNTIIVERGPPLPLGNGQRVRASRQPDSDVGFRPMPKLTIAFENEPFRPALDRLLDAAELTVVFGGERAIRLTDASGAPTPSRSGRVCYSGPLRFEAISVQARRSSLAVTLGVAWEPRLKVISLGQPMNTIRAVDDRGDLLPVTNADACPEALVDGRGMAARFDLPLQLPPQGVRKIAALRGSMSATMAGKMEAFRFQNLESGSPAKKRFAAVEVSLQQVRRLATGESGSAVEIRIGARFDDAGDALASHRQWIFSNPAYLEDADGNRIAYDSYETTAQGRNEVGLAYRFTTDRPLATLTFVYKTPAAILKRQLEFGFADMALP